MLKIKIVVIKYKNNRSIPTYRFFYWFVLFLLVTLLFTAKVIYHICLHYCMLQEEALELSITELVSGSYSDHYVTLGNSIIVYLVPDLWIRIYLVPIGLVDPDPGRPT
jgi:hypothetical protein